MPDQTPLRNATQRTTAVLPIILAIIIFTIAYFSPNSNTLSDSRFSLLVSQALIQHQTIRLDAYYYDQLKDTLPNGKDYRLQEIDNHIYYVYPLGTSFLSAPFIGLLNWLGHDMLIPTDESSAGNILSAIIVTAIFFIIYQIATYYVPPKISIIIASVAILGTTLMSTLGTALWNLDFTVLFICFSLKQLVRLEHRDFSPITPYLLGIFLFLAYFCRPTAAIFIGPTLLFLFIRHRKQFLPTACTASILLLCFSLFSLKEFGLWLPRYYLPRQLGGIQNYSEQDVTPLPIALYGLLFSPSRGLFIYSPILFIPILFAFRYWQRIKQQPLFWFTLVWFIGQLLAVARFKNWWGGYSFGPRLLTDVIPALILLTILVSTIWLKDSSRSNFPIIFAFVFLMALISIMIHSYVGMFRREPALSQGHVIAPSVDKAPYLLLDWHYPQLWANIDSMCLRNRTYYEDMLHEQRISLRTYSLGREIIFSDASAAEQVPPRPWQSSSNNKKDETINANSHGDIYATKLFLPLIEADDELSVNALFIGWLSPAKDGIWSTCQRAEIIIGSLPSAINENELVMEISGRTNGDQMVIVYVNEELVGSLDFSSNDVTLRQIALPTTLFRTEQNNHISLEFPDEIPLSENDFLRLGLFLKDIVIQAPMTEIK